MYSKVIVRGPGTYPKRCTSKSRRIAVGRSKSGLEARLFIIGKDGTQWIDMEPHTAGRVAIELCEEIDSMAKKKTAK